MTDLSDGALRERAQDYVHRYGGIVETLLPLLVALRDAARAEQQEEINGLREALAVMGANDDDAITQAKQARAEQREILEVLWTEFHLYDDHKEDGFGDDKETCHEVGCRRYSAYLRDGKPFTGYAAFAAALRSQR